MKHSDRPMVILAVGLSALVFGIYLGVSLDAASGREWIRDTGPTTVGAFGIVTAAVVGVSAWRAVQRQIGEMARQTAASAIAALLPLVGEFEREAAAVQDRSAAVARAREIAMTLKDYSSTMDLKFKARDALASVHHDLSAADASMWRAVARESHETIVGKKRVAALTAVRRLAIEVENLLREYVKFELREAPGSTRVSLAVENARAAALDAWMMADFSEQELSRALDREINTLWKRISIFRDKAA